MRRRDVRRTERSPEHLCRFGGTGLQGQLGNRLGITVLLVCSALIEFEGGEIETAKTLQALLQGVQVDEQLVGFE